MFQIHIWVPSSCPYTSLRYMSHPSDRPAYICLSHRTGTPRRKHITFDNKIYFQFISFEHSCVCVAAACSVQQSTCHSQLTSERHIHGDHICRSAQHILPVIPAVQAAHDVINPAVYWNFSTIKMLPTTHFWFASHHGHICRSAQHIFNSITSLKSTHPIINFAQSYTRPTVDISTTTHV